MEGEETPTTAALPTPTEVAEAPTTEASPADEQVAGPPAEEPKPEAESETAKPEVEPEPLDPYDELGHERFKSVLERRDRRIEEGVRTDYQRQLEEATGNWKATEAHKQIAGAYGGIMDKLAAGDLEGTEKLIGRLEEAIQPYSDAYKKGIKAEGVSEAAKELYGAVIGSLDHRGQDDLQDYLLANSSAGWGDILKKRDEIREGRTKQSTSEKITSLESQVEGLKAKARPEGPDTIPKGGADGRSDAELQMDMTTPVEKLLEIKARQEAG